MAAVQVRYQHQDSTCNGHKTERLNHVQSWMNTPHLLQIANACGLFRLRSTSATQPHSLTQNPQWPQYLPVGQSQPEAAWLAAHHGMALPLSTAAATAAAAAPGASACASIARWQSAQQTLIMLPLLLLLAALQLHTSRLSHCGPNAVGERKDLMLPPAPTATDPCSAGCCMPVSIRPVSIMPAIHHLHWGPQVWVNSLLNVMPADSARLAGTAAGQTGMGPSCSMLVNPRLMCVAFITCDTCTSTCQAHSMENFRF
jgi:hypothetical protein